MADTAALLQSAESELREIDGELDLHGEKFAALQDKIGRHRRSLHANEVALGALNQTTGIGKFVVVLVVIAAAFSGACVLLSGWHK